MEGIKINVCRYCGAEYPALRLSGKYCSNACKQAAYRKAYRNDYSNDYSNKNDLPDYERENIHSLRDNIGSTLEITPPEECNSVMESYEHEKLILNPVQDAGSPEPDTGRDLNLRKQSFRKKFMEESFDYIDRYASPSIRRGAQVWEEVAITIPLFMAGYIQYLIRDNGMEDDGVRVENNQALISIVFHKNRHRRHICAILNMVLEAEEGRLAESDFQTGGAYGFGTGETESLQSAESEHNSLTGNTGQVEPDMGQTLPNEILSELWLLRSGSSGRNEKS